MMLDEPNQIKLEVQRDDELSSSTTRMNPSINSNGVSLARIESNFSQINGSMTKDNKLFGVPGSERIEVDKIQQTIDYNQHTLSTRVEQQVHHPHVLNNQPQTHDQAQAPYSSSSSSSGTVSSYTNTKSENYSPIAGPSSSSSSAEGSSFDCKPFVQTPLPGVVTMNASAIQHGNSVAPVTAHGSEHHHLSNHHSEMHYSLPARSLPSPNPANMALNFSHDLFLHAGHHSNQTSSHHQDAADNHINKSQLSNPTFDLGSESLMQSAAVGMWKNSMNLSHFNRPNVAEHNFLPNSEMNSFSSWPHGGNMSQQATQSMTHHILDSPHLMSYSQHHQRSSLPLHNQDLVSASLKTQANPGQTAPFMLNTINHQASTSHSVFSHHTNEPPHDSLNARQQQQQQLDHATASYNLAISDNQFYNSPRAENRSHPSSIKPAALLSDRPMQLSFNNHQASQLSYQHHVNNEHANSQPSHLVPGSSSGSSSKAVGTFRCPHCSETFNIRNLYQSHLKTHSQEKGTKAKFQCELCGHSFSQKTSLNRHMKSHTGERPFPCEVCGKAFSEKERLKIHMRTHTGEKPFSCNICGKSFSQKSTVKRHQTVHTGEKKFKCDCGKGFANRGNLIAHIKTRGSNHFE